MSVPHTYEEGRTVSVVALATGSLPVSSAEVLELAEDHAERAVHLAALLRDAGNEYTERFIAKVAREQAAHAYAAQVLRRHAASMTERQPEENGEHEPRAEKTSDSRLQ
jgi:hypothetical protein